MGNKAGTAIWIAVILLAIFIVAEKDLWGLGSTLGLIKEKEEPVSPIDQAFCADPSNTVTLGPLKHKWTPGTSMSSVNIRYYKTPIKADGTYMAALAVNDQGSKTSSTTDTVGWKDKLYLINGYADTTYYGKYQELVAPCNTFTTAGIDGGVNELVANGSATWQNFNSDTGNKNDGAGSDNESIGTAEYGTFHITWTTSDKTGISAGTDFDRNQGKILFVVEINGTAYDETKTTLGGKAPDATSKVPSWYTSVELEATSSQVVAWEFNGCPDLKGDARSCDEDYGNLRVKAETSINPQSGGEAGSIGDGGVKICLIDQEYDQHSITGAPLYGYEDDLGTQHTGVGIQCTYLTVD